MVKPRSWDAIGADPCRWSESKCLASCRKIPVLSSRSDGSSENLQNLHRLQAATFPCLYHSQVYFIDYRDCDDVLNFISARANVRCTSRVREFVCDCSFQANPEPAYQESASQHPSFLESSIKDICFELGDLAPGVLNRRRARSSDLSQRRADPICEARQDITTKHLMA